MIIISRAGKLGWQYVHIKLWLSCGDNSHCNTIQYLMGTVTIAVTNSEPTGTWHIHICHCDKARIVNITLDNLDVYIQMLHPACTYPFSFSFQNCAFRHSLFVLFLIIRSAIAYLQNILQIPQRHTIEK